MMTCLMHISSNGNSYEWYSYCWSLHTDSMYVAVYIGTTAITSYISGKDAVLRPVILCTQ